MTASATRRLAAILVADVVGFSRHMERDDAGTVARLRTLREEVIDPAIADHAGRVVKTAGDGWLVEFASADASLRCAMDIQRSLATCNQGLAEGDRIDFRIGINLGDVIADGGDIFGDGVNVAARLESLAPPGGICVSAALRDLVHGTADVRFTDAGEQRVKNIARPIRTFTVTLAGGPGAPPPDDTTQPRTMSVGVMPLATSDDDPEMARRVRSLTRDFAGMLARCGTLITVIPVSPSHASASPDEPVAIARIARARYLAEGELRSEGGGYALGVRLLDGASGQQLWSESVSLGKALQSREGSRALHSLVWHLSRSLVAIELRRIAAQLQSQDTPLDSVLRALSLDRTEPYVHQRLRNKSRLLEDALGKDPNLVPALFGLVVLDHQRLTYDLAIDRDTILARMEALSARAMMLDDAQPAVWYLRSIALMYTGKTQAAFEACNRSIRMEPHSKGLLMNRAHLLVLAGRPADALPVVEEAITMDSEGGQIDLSVSCRAQLLLGEYARAAELAARLLGLIADDDLDSNLLMAAAFGRNGDLAHAATLVERVLQALPQYTIAIHRSRLPLLESGYLELLEAHMYPGLREAGLPDG